MRPSSRMMPSLPAGFRFHPTDEELIVHYLMNQAASVPCPVPIIAEVNIYHCNPWDLPPKALFGENEWYFFSPRDRKYPNGARPNRAAGSGYWKATGTDKAIVSSAPMTASQSIGVKKALVFYRGKPPRGIKTDWVMHEYRLSTGGNNQTTTAKRRSGSSSSSSSSSMRLDDWVLCRIYKKSNNFQFAASDDHEQGDGSSALEEEEDTSLASNNSHGGAGAPLLPSPKSEEEAHAASDQHFLPPPPPSMMTKSCSLTDLLNTIDYSTLSQLLLDGPPPAETADEPQPQHESSLIHSTTAACHTPLLNNMNNNNTNINDMPQGDGDALLLCPGIYGAGYNNNSSLKRKRIMTTDHGGASSSSSSFFDDDTGVKRKLQQLPSDAASARSTGFFFGGYCNQQLAEAGSSSSSSFQYTGLMTNHNPFLKNQQLLLHSHLQMQ